MTRRHLFFISLILASLFLISPEQDARGEARYTKSMEDYSIPDVTLTNQEGRKIRLRKLLTMDKPVLVDFVYTTCTTICPVLSANFSNFQKKLGPDTAGAHLVSLSIDPENDTPRAMKAYLKRYSAKQGWDFLTGSPKDIDKVIRAFNALSQNKMDHYPIILLKSPSADKWVRLYGLIGTTELMKEFEEVRNGRKSL